MCPHSAACRSGWDRASVSRRPARSGSTGRSNVRSERVRQVWAEVRDGTESLRAHPRPCHHRPGNASRSRSAGGTLTRLTIVATIAAASLTSVLLAGCGSGGSGPGGRVPAVRVPAVRVPAVPPFSSPRPAPHRPQADAARHSPVGSRHVSTVMRAAARAQARRSPQRGAIRRSRCAAVCRCRRR